MLTFSFSEKGRYSVDVKLRDDKYAGSDGNLKISWANGKCSGTTQKSLVAAGTYNAVVDCHQPPAIIGIHNLVDDDVSIDRVTVKDPLCTANFQFWPLCTANFQCWLKASGGVWYSQYCRKH